MLDTPNDDGLSHMKESNGWTLGFREDGVCASRNKHRLVLTQRPYALFGQAYSPIKYPSTVPKRNNQRRQCQELGYISTDDRKDDNGEKEYSGDDGSVWWAIIYGYGMQGGRVTMSRSSHSHLCDGSSNRESIIIVIYIGAQASNKERPGADCDAWIRGAVT